MNSAKNPRKVVSVPVHFVSSTSPANAMSAKEASATVIQKAFRGFLVRKTLKKVASIEKEVDEAGRRVVAGLEEIRRDPKERLRMSETLMGLLFKLDSVRGVGHGVRERRKAVIKKAIVLQEIIDGCDVSKDAADRQPGTDSEGRGYVSGDGDRDLEMEDVVEKPDGNADVANRVGSGGLESEDGIEKVVVLDETVADRAFVIDGRTSGVGDERNDNSNESVGHGLEENTAENDDDCLPKPIKCDKFVDDEEDYCMVKKVVFGERADHEKNPIVNKVDKDCYNGEEDKLENCKNREILERMIEENVKMMNMMKQLSEQHKSQTQMLSLLSRRVEQLEKAFVRETSRKKSKDKKKKAANGLTNGLDFCPDGKKR